uniref:Nuclear migration protein nudC n=1 Tax=Stomoxys calcitrans TaxID=35570 RepID=A0A1I8P8S4_STOCA
MENYDCARADSILSEILEERKSLTGFLDAVFGFLSRRTDFYHEQKSKEEKLGFPRGIKEEILLSCMQKYEKLEDPFAQQYEAPPAIEEVEIETDCCSSTTPDIEMNDKVELENRKYEPNLEFSESDYKNGSRMDKYCWSQTLKDVELSIILPPEVKSAKHVKLNLKSNYISVTSLIPRKEELLVGETWSKYKYNDVVWTIADGKLIISFDKAKEGWWDKLLLHEQCIDIKKLDTERPIEDFSNETQKVIEKIQSQQINSNEFAGPRDLKNLPLSKSEQLARLRQAWNSENSPFKGQPFDPSVIQFS